MPEFRYRLNLKQKPYLLNKVNKLIPITSIKTAKHCKYPKSLETLFKLNGSRRRTKKCALTCFGTMRASCHRAGAAFRRTHESTLRGHPKVRTKSHIFWPMAGCHPHMNRPKSTFLLFCSPHIHRQRILQLCSHPHIIFR